MSIQITNGVSIGPGILVGGGNAQLPNPYPGRLAGTPSTNVAQTYTANGSNYPVLSSTPTPYIGSTIGDFNTGTLSNLPYIKTTSPTPSFTNFGTGEYTIEFIIYIPPEFVSNYHPLLATNIGNGFLMTVGSYLYDANKIVWGQNQQFPTNIASYTWERSAWNFVAIQRKAGQNAVAWAGPCSGGVANKLTMSGTSSASVSYASATNTAGVSIGQYLLPTAGSVKAQFYLNELCVSNVARYDNNATSISIPTQFYTVDSYTTQLYTFQGTAGSDVFENITS